MIKHIIHLILLLLGIVPTKTFARMVLVPQTGQTTSYAAGDDGALRMGVPWPDPRFTDNGDGTITDNLTGLIWLKNADCFSAHNWTTAIASANGLASDACGLTDGSAAGQWRLPNRKELKSLINRGQADSAAWLKEQGFSKVQSGYYWSSSASAYDTSYRWLVCMGSDTSVVSGYKYDYAGFVWPVRSGQDVSTINLPATGQTATYATGDDGNLKKGVAWPSPRFTDNADGTVTDNLTGFDWLKNANCFGEIIWSSAIASANTLSNGACGLTDGSAVGDWRLPNEEQLESLVDISQYNPVLPSGHPFSNAQSRLYWSSTESWAVSMNSSGVYNINHGSHNNAWPVRSGLSWVLDFLIISVKPTPDFGTYILGTTPITRKVTLFNNGYTDINVISIAFDNTADFSIATGGSHPCATLSPMISAESSCTVLATFTPALEGEKTGNLKVTANTKYINVPFTGTGISPLQKLTVTMAGVEGEGAGTVTSDPAGIYCTAGSCFNYFDTYSTVNLHTTASGNSVFDKWTGACTGTSSDTSVLMDGLKSVTANFKYVLALRIPGSPPADYPSILEAYTALAAESSTGTILARSTDLQEDLIFDSDLSLLLKGGYNTDFSSSSGGFTTVTGTITIEKGALTLDQFVIK